MSEIIREVNEFQTPITTEELDKYPEEVVSEFWEYVNSVPFISNLISKDRRRAKDMPKDESGKIIIDFTNPHILEDMDYFRETAIYFEKHGEYTNLRINTHPQSEYMKWLRREIERCWYGMVRPSDGEWITGDFYFYLNYSIMKQTVVKKLPDGREIITRKEDLPKVWEGVYLRMHYLNQAKVKFMHAAEISSRGKSKSYTIASLLTKMTSLGIAQGLDTERASLAVASNKDYLTKKGQGVLEKVMDNFDHLREHTQFPSRFSQDSYTTMNWVLGSETIDGKAVGPQNTLAGVSIADDPDKSRGSRTDLLLLDEFGVFPKFTEWWGASMPNVQEGDLVFGFAFATGCVCKDTPVWNGKGERIAIQDIEDTIIGCKDTKANIEPVTYHQPEAYKPCFRIHTEYRTLECSEDHPIMKRFKKSRRIESYLVGNRREYWWEYDFVPTKELKVGDKLAIIQEVDIFSDETLFDARLVGMLIGDGSYGTSIRTSRNNIAEIKTPVFSNCEHELLAYVDDNYETVIETEYITKDGRNYKELRISNLLPRLREIGIAGQSKLQKRLPSNYQLLDKDNSAELLAGLFDTDGCVTDRTIFLTQSNSEILEEVKILLLKFGVHSYIIKEEPRIMPDRKDKNPWYKLVIGDAVSLLNFIDKIPLIVGDKIEKMSIMKTKIEAQVQLKKSSDGYRIETITKIEDIGVQRVYNLTADDSNTYLANEIVTHNTGGTAGSNFMGALDMIDNPKSKNVLGIPNLFDKGSTGKRESIFFFPSYMNYAPYYNHDGVSDIVKSILVELNVRYVMKYNSKDPMQVTQRRAEFAFTLQDAIMRTSSTIYPVSDLVDTIQNIDNNPEIQQALHVGRIELKDGKALWRLDPSLIPITSFPHKDNKNKGAIVIKTHPITDSNGEVTPYRYIGGADTIETDGAETLSLFSGFILDLWTDQIVAEYTGREDMVDDSFEVFRRLLIYYNAIGNYESNKKGLFGHFSKHNSLHLLSDTLDFLKDRDPQKVRYGNAAKGTPSSKPIKDRGKILIRDYLLKPIETIHINPDTGEEFTMSTYTLKEIPFKALLQELSMHNEDGNFDRHDALVQLMLLREDRLRILGDASFEERYGEAVSKDYMGNDEFFTKNYPGSKHENSQDMLRRLNRVSNRKR